MICLLTKISRDGVIIEHGHMAWMDAAEAIGFAKVIQAAIDIEICEYPDTCSVQEGISRGLYVHHTRLVDTK